ncbi:M48 family metalloprotease [Candidatus Bandiella numerosa]|uniref:M48 family metalloprotease n=1 Tax=Candidatus Bandiella numerosa TaxID=2570586 RepID=UPI00249EFD0A|nr:M48 family metalloprotease [Candidatus Bandiella numerosa]WHA04666.1 M48 family metalloprotease [Candidatus Bandiella numerosa]
MKLIYFFIFQLFLVFQSYAEQILYDDEVNNYFHNLSTPIFKVANLDDRNIKIQIILSNVINAFVSDGSNVYLYTGLICNSDDLDGLIGVIAHETAHIKQSHILKFKEEINLSKKKAIFSTIMGLAIGLATNEPGIATIGVLSGVDRANLEILKHSRHNEYAADRLALKYLQDLGIKKEGMVSFFKKLENKERIFNFTNSYRLTHPLSRERIKSIESSANDNIIKNNTRYPSKQLQNRFNLIKAKLFALTHSPKETLDIYNCNKDYCLYAQSFAYGSQKNYLKSITLIDKLIEKEPNYEYFYLTKAQYLFEFGKIEESTSYYERSIKINPGLYVAKYELSNNLILLKKDMMRVISMLKELVFHFKHIPEIWKKLGNAYYINQNYFEANKCYIEDAILRNDKKLGKLFLVRAKKYQKTTEQKNELAFIEKKLNELKE